MRRLLQRLILGTILLSASGTVPAWADLPNEITGRDGAPMVLVLAGSFTMGDGSENAPVQHMTVPSYYIDQYEVTNALYATFLHAFPAYFRSQPLHRQQQHVGLEEASRNMTPDNWERLNLHEQGNFPVRVPVWGAHHYCQWAGKRLPSEAEWEKAARGTDGRTVPWGSEAGPQRSLRCCHPVGSRQADRSPYGVYDLGGNAPEWVSGTASYGSEEDILELTRFRGHGPLGGEGGTHATISTAVSA